MQKESLNNQALLFPEQTQQQEIIFFIGLPFLGKSTYFEFVYEINGYDIISFQEESISKSIANLFDKLNNNLKKKIVIDNERIFIHKKARISLIEKIKKEFPKCTIQCIIFKPKSNNFLQCDLAKEFYIAEHFEGMDYQFIDELNKFEDFTREILQHNSNDIDNILKNFYPTEEEGFNKIIVKEMNLFLNRSENEFCYRSLILDFSSAKIINYQQKNRKFSFCNIDLFKKLILQWTERHSHSRILVIIRDKEMYRNSLNIPANHVNSLNLIELIRDLLIELNLSLPIYYFTMNDDKSITSNNNLSITLCHLLYLYSVKLNESLFVTEEDLPNDFQCYFANLPKINYTNFLQLDNLTNYELPNLFNLSQSQSLFPFEYHANYKQVKNDEEEEDDSKRKNKRFPLLNELANNENITDECYFELTKKKRMNGIILPRNYISYFEYQEDYFENVNPEETEMEEEQGHCLTIPMIDEEEEEDNERVELENKLNQFKKSTININNNNLIFQVQDPFGNNQEDKQDEEMELSPTGTQSSNFLPTPPSKQQTSTSSTSLLDKIPSNLNIKMTIHEIMNHFGMTYFQRGRDYKNEYRILYFKTKVINPLAFKLYSTCQGSRIEPYKQETIIKEGKVLKAICNCPIGHEGLCKHVCAQLLAFRDKENYLKSLQQTNNSDNDWKSTSMLPLPITFSELDPLNENWCIKGKVVKKHTIKTWANERGSGRVGAITLIDELQPSSSKKSNQLKAIMFNEAIDEFYDKMEEYEVYYIYGGHLIWRNNEEKYEIQLNVKHSIVRSPKEEEVVKKNQLNLVDSERKQIKEENNYQQIFKERLENQNKVIEFEEFKEEAKLNQNTNQMDLTEDNNFIAESSPKKRKSLSSTEVEKVDKSKTKLSPTKKRKSQSKEPVLNLISNMKKDINPIPASIDTRFEQLMNGNFTQSQKSASQKSTRSDKDDDIIIIEKEEIKDSDISLPNNAIQGIFFDEPEEKSPKWTFIPTPLKPKEEEHSPVLFSSNTSKSLFLTPNISNKRIIASPSLNHSQQDIREEEQELHSAEDDKSFEDIFFTPSKMKISKQTKSDSKQLITLKEEINLSNQITSPSPPNFSKPSLTPPLKSPNSLSQHNKPKVMEVVELSDGEGEIEVLEQITPLKKKKKQTNTEEHNPSPNMNVNSNSTVSIETKTPNKPKISLKDLLANNKIEEL
ncbi:hypothetical protein ABK040_007889 [Willaertia magna]